MIFSVTLASLVFVLVSFVSVGMIDVGILNINSNNNSGNDYSGGQNQSGYGNGLPDPDPQDPKDPNVLAKIDNPKKDNDNAKKYYDPVRNITKDFPSEKAETANIVPETNRTSDYSHTEKAAATPAQSENKADKVDKVEKADPAIAELNARKAEFKKAQNKVKKTSAKTWKAHEIAEKAKDDLAKARASKDLDSEEVKTLEAKAKRTNNEYNTLKKEEEDLKAERDKAKVKVAEVKVVVATVEDLAVAQATAEDFGVMVARYNKVTAEKDAIIAECDKYKKDYYKAKDKANKAKSDLDIAKNEAKNAKGIYTAFHVAKAAEAKLKKAEDKYQTRMKELEDLKAKKEEAKAKVKIAKDTESKAFFSGTGKTKGKTIAADAKPNEETTAANKPDEQLKKTQDYLSIVLNKRPAEDKPDEQLKKTQDYLSIVLNKRPAEDNSEGRPSKILKGDKGDKK
jgi:hypothetical protein